AEFRLLRLQHLSDAFSVRRGAVAVATTATRTAITVFTVATLATLPVTRTTFGGTALMGRRIMLEHFALEDPHLDADHAISRLRFGNAVVDVGAQRMQRDAALAVPFGTSDVCAAETATDIDTDATGAHADRRLHGALHRTAESHAALELLGDALGNEG